MTKVPVQLRKAVPAASAAASTAVTDSWQALRNEMDRVFDRFSEGFGMPSLRRMFDFAPTWSTPSAFNFAVPAVDVSEDEKSYTVAAELPGMEEKDVEVTVSGDMLTIKGEKRAEKEEKEKNYYISERSYGEFRRTFVLPEGIDREKIAATFAKGVLTVSMPKTVEAQKEQKKIQVKAAA